MDNITHSLIGALVGDTADRLVPGDGKGLPPGTRRTLGIGLMVTGSNLPDADILYSTITGSKLDYLLQHRGHTHTIAGALVMAALMIGICHVWSRWRGHRWSARDAGFLAGMASLATLLHVALDFTNSYGVHPFWPVRNDWFYGDAVFIVEPLLWATATPLVWTLQSRLARGLVGLAVSAGIVLSFFTGLVPIPFALGLVALVVLLAGVAIRRPSKESLAAGLTAWLCVTILFFLTGSIAEARLDRVVTAGWPRAQTLDRVLTPMPVNPVCREVFAVQAEGDQYVVRKGTLSLLPDWLPASECPQRVLGIESTAPLSAVPLASTNEIQWAGQFTMGRSRLRELDERYCEVRALLRFARVPWAAREGSNWIVGDLRYDREPELGLAEIETGSPGGACPALMPPWIPPRLDVLSTSP